MIISVPKEIVANERRVALDPERVGRLVKNGMQVLVEFDAGEGAFFSNEAFEAQGAGIVADPQSLYDQADVVLKINPPIQLEGSDRHEVDRLREGSTLISFLYPQSSPDLVRRLLDRKVTSFSMDLVPRIARAQKMDALSSMSSMAGYKSVLIAAQALGKYLPMLITAAGTIPPAKVLVLGAGVAGLQAIATARRLGAVVSAYDVRPVVKEQVESLGAKFLEIDLGESTEDAGGYAKALSEEAQRMGNELIHNHIKKMDIVITTALIPGRPAPELVSELMVKDMMPGSVIVDLAAETGGNCALTKPGETVIEHGVTIFGLLNIPGTMPVHASQLYARNILALLEELVRDGELQLDFEDEIVAETCVTHAGEPVNERVKAMLSQGATSHGSASE